MDEICQLLSEKIFAATGGGYGVFYEDELLDLIPEDERTRETLEAALKKLVKCGCIDVKYAKGSAFCMSGLKTYEPPAEDTPTGNITPQKPQALSEREKTKFYLSVFFLAFAGGALGSFLCGLIIYAL